MIFFANSASTLPASLKGWRDDHKFLSFCLRLGPPPKPPFLKPYKRLLHVSIFRRSSNLFCSHMGCPQLQRLRFFQKVCAVSATCDHYICGQGAGLRPSQPPDFLRLCKLVFFCRWAKPAQKEQHQITFSAKTSKPWRQTLLQHPPFFITIVMETGDPGAGGPSKTVCLILEMTLAAFISQGRELEGSRHPILQYAGVGSPILQ